MRTNKQARESNADLRKKGWWLGNRRPPDWAAELPLVLSTIRDPRELPPDTTALVLVDAPTPGRPEDPLDTLRRIVERSAHAVVVVLTDQPTTDHELTLLSHGATMMVPRASESALATARVGALLEQVSAPSARGRQSSNSGDNWARPIADLHGHRLMTLAYAARLLTTVQDEDEIFRRLVQTVATELDSRRVSLMHVDRERGVLQMRCAVGIPDHVVKEARARIGEGIAGTCAALGRPIFIDDHRQYRRSGQSDLSEYMPEGQSFTNLPMSLTVPLKVKGEVVGVVNITDRRGQEPYSKEDIVFISALLGQAGSLLENAALVQHLHEVRAFNERVINTITDPLAVLSTDQRIVSCNERFATRFNGSTGDRLQDRVSIAEEARASLDRALTTDEAAGLQDLGEWSTDGRLYDASVAPLADSENVSHLLFLRDVTARRQMERRLAGAEKMASLGVLAAGVAHEINNPLGCVKSNMRSSRDYFDDLLALVDEWRQAGDKCAEPALFEAARQLEAEIDLDDVRQDIRAMLDETVEGIGRVENIVLALKGFAHPDTEKPYRRDVTALVENAITITRGKWKQSLELVREFEAVDEIWCLPNQLEQVFMNLIVNAAQAAGEWGRLVIEITKARGGILLRFADTGAGIPTEIQERIFDPFFTTKEIGEGTGLGLAIAYNIIENHGGTISVSSQMGQGTAFEIWFPQGGEERPIVVAQSSRFRI